MEDLKQVWRIMEGAGMWLNKKKCQIRPPILSIIGHQFIKDGLIADPYKIIVITNYPRPTDKKKLQRLMGMVNYLRKFCAKLGDVAAPLSELQGATTFWNWSHMHQKVFEPCKAMMSSGVILKPINHDSPENIYLMYYASIIGLSGWLGQMDSKVGKIRPAEY